jgi:hypothetical protein
LAEARIEGALHDIVEPATARVAIEASRLAAIEPESLLATVAVDAAAVSGP